MYLKQIYIKNFRCFEEVTIDLHSPTAERASWLLVLGDNSTGKTALLRCIAIGLCDETSASALVRELPGDLIRNGEKEATITLEFEDPNQGARTFHLTTTIRRTGSGEEVKQTAERDWPWGNLFACGYGATRQLLGGGVADERFRVIDSVYTLFNYISPLQDPETVFLRMSRFGADDEKMRQRIDDVLMLPQGSVILSRTGLVISGPWGQSVPIAAVGDGYQVMLAWIADLLYWWMLFAGDDFDPTIRGIVLLDEIEQHLHPSWQREVIGLLRKMFPFVQFITTTHAPLCAIGSAKLSDEECQLVLLERNEGAVRPRPNLKPPRWRRADQVLTSYLFGLPSTSSDDLTFTIERYAGLYREREHLDKEKSRQLEELRQSLDTYLQSTETELQSIVRRAVNETLQRLAEDVVSKGQVDQRGLQSEVKRQIEILLAPGSRSND